MGEVPTEFNSFFKLWTNFILIWNKSVFLKKIIFKLFFRFSSGSPERYDAITYFGLPKASAQKKNRVEENVEEVQFDKYSRTGKIGEDSRGKGSETWYFLKKYVIRFWNLPSLISYKA